jgi:glycosyltransferase involved in cell wall biosynthesis
MAAYNVEAYVGEAIDSMLAQSYPNFELVVVDDGSIDSTAEIVSGYANRDTRVRLLQNQSNCGLIKTRNRLFDEARFPLVAIADSDDVAHPQRLARQVAFLESHPEVGLVGSDVEFLLEEGADAPTQVLRQSDEEIRYFQRLLPCFWNTTTMYRKDVLEKVGPYDPAYGCGAEDYHLWSRIAAITKLANLPDRLMRVRIRRGSLTASGAEWFDRVLEISTRLLGDYLAREVSLAERRELHRFLTLEALDPAACRRSLNLLDLITERARTVESPTILRMWTTSLARPAWTHSRYLVYRDPALSRRLLRMALQYRSREVPFTQLVTHVARMIVPRSLRIPAAR